MWLYFRHESLEAFVVHLRRRIRWRLSGSGTPEEKSRSSDECRGLHVSTSDALENEHVEQLAANRLTIRYQYDWRNTNTALALGFLLPNDGVEQLAAKRLTIPQDVIASLLQRLVLAAWFIVLHTAWSGKTGGRRDTG